jgi:hypothetical protein
MASWLVQRILQGNAWYGDTHSVQGANELQPWHPHEVLCILLVILDVVILKMGWLELVSRNSWPSADRSESGFFKRLQQRSCCHFEAENPPDIHCFNRDQPNECRWLVTVDSRWIPRGVLWREPGYLVESGWNKLCLSDSSESYEVFFCFGGYLGLSISQSFTSNLELKL